MLAIGIPTTIVNNAPTVNLFTIMDIRYRHGTDIFVLRACMNDDALDLIAFGGEHSVEVLLVVRLSLAVNEDVLEQSNVERFRSPPHRLFPYWYKANGSHMVSKNCVPYDSFRLAH